MLAKKKKKKKKKIYVKINNMKHLYFEFLINLMHKFQTYLHSFSNIFKEENTQYIMTAIV